MNCYVYVSVLTLQHTLQGVSTVSLIINFVMAAATILAHTVPLKGNLTVTRDTRHETRQFRVLCLKSHVSSRVSNELAARLFLRRGNPTNDPPLLCAVATFLLKQSTALWVWYTHIHVLHSAKILTRLCSLYSAGTCVSPSHHIDWTPEKPVIIEPLLRGFLFKRPLLRIVAATVNKVNSALQLHTTRNTALFHWRFSTLLSKWGLFALKYPRSEHRAHRTSFHSK